MKNPVILIYANVFDTSVGQTQAYMNFFSQFGDVVMVTSEMDLNRMIEFGDILALPGGMDLNPDRYGSKPGFEMKVINAHYEHLDRYLLLPWIETGKPIIGICRGMQALNVVCGGTLHRHIKGHVQDDNKYWRHDTPQLMYTELKNRKGEYSYPILSINSLHHQCVNVVAPGFNIIGWSEFESNDQVRKITTFKGKKFTFDKSNSLLELASRAMVPEIMVHETLPYVAFQYHPEEFDCPLAIKLIRETLDKYDQEQIIKEEEHLQNIAP